MEKKPCPKVQLGLMLLAHRYVLRLTFSLLFFSHRLPLILYSSGRQLHSSLPFNPHPLNIFWSTSASPKLPLRGKLT